MSTQPEKILRDLRLKIDELDQDLFTLLAKRMSLVLQIGALKRAQGLVIADPVREALLKAKLKKFAADVLEPRHVEELASVIIRISRDLQNRQPDKSRD